MLKIDVNNHGFPQHFLCQLLYLYPGQPLDTAQEINFLLDGVDQLLLYMLGH